MNRGDTIDGTAVRTTSGKFQVRIDLRKTQQNRKREQSFQFGIALAKHSATRKAAQSVVWSSRTSAIPSTVRMLSVPAAPKLSAELEQINRASGWPFSNPNGVELIRAVNALQALGK